MLSSLGNVRNIIKSYWYVAVFVESKILTMGASNHPPKGLCTPKMEPIHKINYIKRRLAKVRTVPEKKSIDDNIIDSLKRRLLSFEESFISLAPKSPENHMWDQ